MTCVYESFCLECELEYDIIAFDDQYDDFLDASILASICSFPSPSHKSLPTVPPY